MFTALLLGAAGATLLTVAAQQPAAPVSQAAAPPAHRAAVVTAARPLAAYQPITAADVAVQMVDVPAEMSTTLVASISQAVGRASAVPVPAGAPLTTAEMLAGGGPVAGHRVVSVTLDARHVSPLVASGALVDVVAALDGAGGRARTEDIAVARVVAVAPAAAGSATDASATRPAGEAEVLSLDCDAASAMSVLWAATFARSVDVLVRPPAEAASSLPPAALAAAADAPTGGTP